jgi:T-complex protein 1 subunit eta
MDKMITEGGRTTISNDGVIITLIFFYRSNYIYIKPFKATILNLLNVVHPAAKTLVDIAKSQDNEVGDGTTTVTLLAGELLKEAKFFIEEGMHS